jgi:hypothetical protein
METERIQRNVSELPSLRRFRRFCFACMSGLLIGFLFVSAITVVPQIEWLVGRATLLTAIGVIYFFVIGLRTHVIICQLTRNHQQTFDRPCPEWITVGFLLCETAVVIWPHMQ